MRLVSAPDSTFSGVEVASLNSFKARRTLTVGSKSYTYFSLKAAEKNGLKGISRLPNSLKILLENLLRYEDGRTVTAADIKAVAGWLKKRTSDREIAYRPARVLMQDFTGVPAVVDLAAMRAAASDFVGRHDFRSFRVNPSYDTDSTVRTLTRCEVKRRGPFACSAHRAVAII